MSIMIFQCDLKLLSERRKCVFRDLNFQIFPGGGGGMLLVSHSQILRQIRPWERLFIVYMGHARILNFVRFCLARLNWSEWDVLWKSRF